MMWAFFLSNESYKEINRYIALICMKFHFGGEYAENLEMYQFKEYIDLLKELEAK